MKKTLLRELLEILLFGLVVLLFIKTFVFRNFLLPTVSMENTLLVGDHITTNSFLFGGCGDPLAFLLPQREPKRGDVVAFRYPGDQREVWMKRIIGMPGDAFSFKADRCYTGETPLTEPYTFYKLPIDMRKSDRDPDNQNRPLGYDDLRSGIENADPTLISIASGVDVEKFVQATRKNLRHFEKEAPHFYQKLMARLDSAPKGQIPPGFYVLLGDNRNRSFDSRRWGLVPRELLLGKAYLVWWSYGEEMHSDMLQGKDKLSAYLRLPIRIWTHTRFPESLRLIR